MSKDSLRRALSLGLGLVIPALLLSGASGLRGAQATTADPAAKDYEAVALLGEKLVSPAPEAAALARYEEAKKAWASDPSEENFIWLGRRAAYIGRHREAIAVYSQGLERFPASFRLLRHRGHRYITLRQFGRAMQDLERAAELAAGRPLEVEPDGVPNAANRPVSNTHFSIYYHLGLARYLAGDYARAEAAYRECLKWAKNDDSIVAVTDWLYLTLRRLGKEAAAQKALELVHTKMEIVENQGYYRRLLMYKGKLSLEDLMAPRPGESEAEQKANFAIHAYGLVNWYLWQKDRAKARETLERLLRETGWGAFAHIAAEVDFSRLVQTEGPYPSIQDVLRAWTVMWNHYDISLAERLFLKDERLTYFSSETKGVLKGFAALAAHHQGFGFVPGGRAQDNRLWLEDVSVGEFGPAAVVTARWRFDKNISNAGPVQEGPVTFVLVLDGGSWRIAHAHFAND